MAIAEIQHTNGLDKTMDEPVQTWHGLGHIVAAEWRVLLTVLAPFGVAVALYFIPATKAELETVKTNAESSVTLVKTDATAAAALLRSEISGELKATKAELKGDINTLTARVNGMQETVIHTQNGVDELLRRSAPVQTTARAEPAEQVRRDPPRRVPRAAAQTRAAAAAPVKQPEGWVARIFR